MTVESQNRWSARNAVVSAMARTAAAFRWPRTVLDEVGEGTEARAALVRARSEYQASIQTQLRAYRVNRNRGDEIEAQANISAMTTATRDIAATVNRVRRAVELPVLQTIENGLTSTLDSVANTVSTTATNYAGGFGQGAGLALVVLGVGALWWLSKK
jgi:hypothetical protein